MTIAAPPGPIIALCFGLNPTTTAAQASQTQSNPQSNQGQTQAQQQDVPDAPSAVQPAAKLPQPAPPEEKPTTQPPTGQPGAGNRGVPSSPTSHPDSEEPATPPPPMPPITTAPPGSVPKQQSRGQEQIYKLSLSVNFVQVPVTVKDRDGRPVVGLLPKDFTVLENGKPQKLTFFTSDP